MPSCKINGYEKPKTCIECPFLGDFQLICTDIKDDNGDYLWQRISFCKLHPKDIEDPFRSTGWFIHNTEDWCPIEKVEE